MVSTKVLKELRELYNSNDRSIDMHKYSDRLFDVLFDINTADTFIAGVASKILASQVVDAAARRIINTPLLVDGGLWRCENGETFDTGTHAEIDRVAKSVEKLRAKCEEALR